MKTERNGKQSSLLAKKRLIIVWEKCRFHSSFLNMLSCSREEVEECFDMKRFAENKNLLAGERCKTEGILIYSSLHYFVSVSLHPVEQFV